MYPALSKVDVWCFGFDVSAKQYMSKQIHKTRPNNIYTYSQNNDGKISEAELEALMRDLIIKEGKVIEFTYFILNY